MKFIRANYMFRKCASYIQDLYADAQCHFKRSDGSTSESVWSHGEEFIFVVGQYIAPKEIAIHMITAKTTQSKKILLKV